MAARKGSTGRKKKKTTSAKGQTRKKEVYDSRSMETEIILWIILAASAVLLVSNFGIGGAVGNAISSFFFGLVGLVCYPLPFFLFLRYLALWPGRSGTFPLPRSIYYHGGSYVSAQRLFCRPQIPDSGSHVAVFFPGPGVRSDSHVSGPFTELLAHADSRPHRVLFPPHVCQSFLRSHQGPLFPAVHSL